MSVSPPFDMLTGLPGMGVGKLVELANKLISQLTDKIGEALDDAIKLPDDCLCDDPRIEALKKKIQDIQDLIAKVQKVIEIIQKIISALKIAMTVAAAIKSAIFFIPVVGQAALQAELVNVQNMLIANTIQAVKQLNIIPDIMNSGLGLINSQLAQIIGKLSGKCQGESFPVSDEIQSELESQDTADNIPEWRGDSVTGAGSATGTDLGTGWILISGSGACGVPLGQPPGTPSPHTDTCGDIWRWTGQYYNPDGISVGSKQSRIDDATVGTEFYTDINVSMEDLNQFGSTIETLVNEQRNLLSSLQESPAQAYDGIAPPSPNLGKPGDYYKDSAAKKLYGPKKSTGWPAGVNY